MVLMVLERGLAPLLLVDSFEAPVAHSFAFCTRPTMQLCSKLTFPELGDATLREPVHPICLRTQDASVVACVSGMIPKQPTFLANR